MKKKITLRELMKQYNDGDISARDEIFNRYKKTAERIAKEYENCGIDYEELLQLAYLGILEGIEKYKDKNSYNFTTIITLNIHLTIKNALLPSVGIDNNHTINQKKIINVLLAIKRLTENDIQLTLEDLIFYTKLTKEEVIDCLKELYFFESVDSRHILNSTLDRIIPNDLEGQLMLEEIKEKLLNIIPQLPERRVKIMHDIYCENMTQEEIGKKMGINRSRVGQIKRQTLRRIKRKLLYASRTLDEIDQNLGSDLLNIIENFENAKNPVYKKVL